MSRLLHGSESDVGDLPERALEWIKRRLADSPVGVIGDKRALDAALQGSVTDDGLGLDQAWERFADVVAPNNIGLDSERFLAFIPLSPSVASVWMDTIVSAANFSAESWLEGAGAVAAENQVIELLCRAAGMPAGAAGCFMSGGSIGNLSALAVGRAHAGDRRFVAVADTAHASVDNALHLLGLQSVVVPTGPDCRLTGDAVRTTIGDRRDVGIVIAAGGSTNAGVVDDLAGCADVAGEIDAWFHVDGAYGLAAVLLPELRDRFVGLERADSFIVDPHKWFFAPFDSCALVYRDPAIAKAAHTQHAEYLDVLTDGDEWNPSDYAHH
ncbi:MAG: pyridoxal-dependent decarboxylase, partial [Ilumatobacteraceae bacterium]